MESGRDMSGARDCSSSLGIFRELSSKVSNLDNARSGAVVLLRPFTGVETRRADSVVDGPGRAQLVVDADDVPSRRI